MKSRSTCPSCNAVLEFDRVTLNMVKCPKCAHQGKVEDFKEIPMQSIHCLKCKTPLKVSKNIASQYITCPRCKHTITVGNPVMKTELPADEEKKYKLYRPGRLELQQDDGDWLPEDKTVTLMRGMNTLGRKSPNSTSSIQLPTKDAYMSKNHAQIEVIMKPNAVFVHRLSDQGSTNNTFHNGDPLESGEVINLMHGDTIRLGHTTFMFITE